MMRSFLAATAALIALGTAGPAGANLIGDTVNAATNSLAIVVTPTSAVVGAGIEFEYFLFGNPLPEFSGDVDAFSFTFSYLRARPGIYGGFEVSLSDLDFAGAPGGITGVTVTSDVAGIDASDVVFTSNSVALNIGGQWTPGDRVTLTFDVTPPVAVPEPVSLGLLGAGLLGLAGVMRRRAGS